MDNQRKTEIPMSRTDGVRVADLNRDGNLDIVAISELEPGRHPSGGRRPLYHGDPYTNMLIFWGKNGDYSLKRSTALPTVGAGDATVADLNSDGWLDIAVTSYHAGDHRSYPGYIYWNSPKGFDRNRKQIFPMYSGCGIFATDINRDGFNDLVWANHTIVGDHRAYVSVAYGSARGPDSANAVKLPALGPHYFNCADLGNVYDRSGRFDYTSAPYDAGDGARFERISWEVEMPRGTGVEFQIRTAATRDGLEKTVWTGPTSAKDYYRRSGAAISPTSPKHKWIQFKATLISDSSAASPVLRSVSMGYAKSPAP